MGFLKGPSSFVAPYMEVVSKYYKPRFTNIQEGVDFIAGFLRDPAPDKSILPADVKAKYGYLAESVGEFWHLAVTFFTFRATPAL